MKRSETEIKTIPIPEPSMGDLMAAIENLSREMSDLKRSVNGLTDKIVSAVDRLNGVQGQIYERDHIALDVLETAATKMRMAMSHRNGDGNGNGRMGADGE